MHLGINTVTRYLKQGVKLNWCSYSSKDNNIRNGMNNAKKVKCLETNKEYVSISDCVKQFADNGIKLIPSGIRKQCNNQISHHKWYHFEFT